MELSFARHRDPDYRAEAVQHMIEVRPRRADPAFRPNVHTNVDKRLDSHWPTPLDPRESLPIALRLPTHTR